LRPTLRRRDSTTALFTRSPLRDRRRPNLFRNSTLSTPPKSVPTFSRSPFPCSRLCASRWRIRTRRYVVRVVPFLRWQLSDDRRIDLFCPSIAPFTGDQGENSRGQDRGKAQCREKRSRGEGRRGRELEAEGGSAREHGQGATDEEGGELSRYLSSAYVALRASRKPR
jgi:hypothetical protein